LLLKLQKRVTALAAGMPGRLACCCFSAGHVMFDGRGVFVEGAVEKTFENGINITKVIITQYLVANAKEKSNLL
jgi:hypothetical protein